MFHILRFNVPVMSVPNTYSNVHRRFLQIMMNRRMVSHEDALKAFIGCYNTYGTNSTGLTDKEYQNLMESAIKMINQVIKQFNMAIRSAEDEITCHQFYLFINTADNPITKKFSKYSSSELEFFKQVLSEIVSAEDGRVPSTVCLNLSLGPAKQMSKSSMEDLIDKLCNDLWLVQKVCKLVYFILCLISRILKIGWKTDI
ncbi:hypothetical protein C0J52_02902 [Blattella germanica]|nr:hypothetical protein C0J52_02902 [Blattella germanica]